MKLATDSLIELVLTMSLLTELAYKSMQVAFFPPWDGVRAADATSSSQHSARG